MNKRVTGDEWQVAGKDQPWISRRALQFFSSHLSPAIFKRI